LILLVAALDALEPLLMKSLFDALGLKNDVRTFVVSVTGLVLLVNCSRAPCGLIHMTITICCMCGCRISTCAQISPCFHPLPAVPFRKTCGAQYIAACPA